MRRPDDGNDTALIAAKIIHLKERRLHADAPLTGDSSPVREEVVQAQKGHDGDHGGRNEVSTQRHDQDRDQAEEGGGSEIEEPVTAVGQQQDGGAGRQGVQD